jgi:hypothetical protein
MKSLNALASLLIAQMGTKGMRTLLALAAIAVFSFELIIVGLFALLVFCVYVLWLLL